MLQNNLGKLAVVCILAGAVLLAGPTFGFSSIAADRGVSVSTADNAHAMLGIDINEDASNTELRGDSNPRTVATLENNLNEDVTVTTAEIVAIGNSDVNDDLLVVSTPQADTTSITPSDPQPMAVTCNREISAGEQEVQFRVGVGGSTVSITNVRFTVPIDIQCKKGQFSSPASFEASDIDVDGPTQRFWFDVSELKNKDVAIVNLSDSQESAGVDYTDAEANVVGGHKTKSIGFDGDTYQIIYEAGSDKGTIEIKLTGFEITGDEDGTAWYTDDQDREDRDTFSVPAVSHNGGDITTDGDAVVPDDGTAGEVDAGGDVTIGDQSTVNDGLNAGGSTTTGESSIVNGALTANGDVTTGDGSTINDGIEAGGNVYLGDTSETNGGVSGDTVTVGEDALINDWITADTDVILEDGSTVHGDIDAGGTVFIGCNVTTNGEITAENIDEDEGC